MKKYALFLIGFLCCLFASAQTDTGNNAKAKYDSSEIFDMLIKPRNKILFGIASFYSRHLEGTNTSSGEKFHHHLYTAASNDFKLGTWVKVTNVQNDKFVVVRINDRMHSRMQKKGRVIDLPIGAARELDFIKEGITKVKVEIVDAPVQPAK